MRKQFLISFGLLAFALADHAQAQGSACASVPQVMPAASTLLAPVSAELVSLTEQVTISGGVLSRGTDEAQSLEQVLLRMRVDECRDAVRAAPVQAAVNPNDPATYKPQTPHDNTPWRFNMIQDGKRMTADEFSAWMEARGLRVAGGAPATAQQPEVAEPAPEQPQQP